MSVMSETQICYTKAKTGEALIVVLMVVKKSVTAVVVDKIYTAAVALGFKLPTADHRIGEQKVQFGVRDIQFGLVGI